MDIILVVVSAILGIGMVWAKVSKVALLLTELSELLMKVTQSLSDKNLSKEELAGIKKEAIEVAAAARNIFSK